MDYEILDNISRADIAFRVRGIDPGNLFINGARALIAIMLEHPEAVRPSEAVTFSVTAPALDLLYYDFLTEFLFYKDSRKLVLLPDLVEILGSEGAYTLSCTACGEKIDRSRHVFRTDIKAITMHSLDVSMTDHDWQATVVVDV